MNKDNIIDLQNPLRVTIKGKAKIIYTNQGKYVLKNSNNTDINKLFNYLISRNFNHIPKLLNKDRDNYNIYEFNEEIEMPKEQKAQDLINAISDLHNKTTFFKEVTEDKYNEIYENLQNNIRYLNNYYNTLFDEYLNVEFMSPSMYLFTRNYTTIKNALSFCETELNKWYQLVKESNRQRVVLLHNNISLDHYIKGAKDYLISWENSRVDTPVWDIVKFYREEYYDLEFNTILKNYLNNYKLNEDELKLLFILLVIPSEITFTKDEYYNTNQVRIFLDYIYKTEKLIRPYYSKQEKEK